MPKHPMQPVVRVGKVHRFKENKIVRLLLDTHPTVDMNTLACMDFTREDRNQFAQLIGYSVDGFAELSYHLPTILKEADKQSEALLSKGRKK